MLTFLHLSDLHFSTKDADTQFDRDIKIREALLDDLGKEGRTEFDAILVTGDIANHGLAEEFNLAKSWFEKIRTQTKSNPEALFVVPGNHDVNHGTVFKSSMLWDVHQTLRDPKLTRASLNESLKAKLKDHTLDFLAALKEYSAFAQEFDCPTSCKELAWVQCLNGEKKLEDGTVVRFHGLNSALLSDGADAKGNLLLSEFQFKHFDNDPSYVNVVLCHHPHNWLLDDNEANDYFRKNSQILLSGHEHDLRCYNEGGCLRVRAGAIHPNRSETGWEPCYHVLRLSVDTSIKRELIIEVETRVWRDKEKCFAKYIQEDCLNSHIERIPLKAWVAPEVEPQLSTPKKSETSVSLIPEKTATPMTPDAFSAARRKLIIYFFRVGTIARFKAAIKAGVWEEGDDAFDGQERWARVFERAERMDKLKSLWEALAAENQTIIEQNNPFT